MTALDQLRAREGLLAVSAGAVLWGTNGVLVTFLTRHSQLGAVSIGFYRLAFSSLVLVVVAGRASLRTWRRAAGRARVLLVLSGVLLGSYQALYFAAIGNVGVSVSTLVSLAIAPLAITVAKAAQERSWPAPRALGVLILAIAGLALISITAGSHHGTAPHPWLGIAESIASGLGYAASTLIGARLQPTAGPFALTAMASVVGAVTLLPVAAGAGLAFHPDARTVSSLAYMGIVATAVAYWLFFRGLGSTPSDVAAVLTLLEPLAATLLAVALVGERLAATGWLGGSLLLLAVAVLYLRVESPSVEEELGTRP